jgi:hypothetical protein
MTSSQLQGAGCQTDHLHIWSPSLSTPDPTPAELAEQYRAGSTLQQLAARYGVHPTTVGRALARAGVQRRPRGRRPFGGTR